MRPRADVHHDMKECMQARRVPTLVQKRVTCGCCACICGLDYLGNGLWECLRVERSEHSTTMQQAGTSAATAAEAAADVVAPPVICQQTLELMTEAGRVVMCGM